MTAGPRKSKREKQIVKNRGIIKMEDVRSSPAGFV